MGGLWSDDLIDGALFATGGVWEEVGKGANRRVGISVELICCSMPRCRLIGWILAVESCRI